MKKTIFTTICICLIIGLSYTRSFTYSSGPPANNVNIKGSNCTSCHGGTTLNKGGGSVVVQIAGQKKPYYYQLDSTYTVNVIVLDSKAKNFGFQAAVVDNTTSYAQAGTTSTGGYNTSTTTSKSVTYVYQNTSSSTDTTHHYHFKWKAPSSGKNIIRIFACGNGADGKGNSSGDHIYAVIDTLNYKAISTDIYNIAITQPVLRFYSNNLHVVLPENYNASATLNIYDIQGRTIESNRMNGHLAINLAYLSAGMYVAALIDENGAVQTLKFIKN